MFLLKIVRVLKCRLGPEATFLSCFIVLFCICYFICGHVCYCRFAFPLYLRTQRVLPLAGNSSFRSNHPADTLFSSNSIIYARVNNIEIFTKYFQSGGRFHKHFYLHIQTFYGCT